jgi:uncharacterized protein YggU (UPF0235/DUF167 family)
VPAAAVRVEAGALDSRKALLVQGVAQQRAVELLEGTLEGA